MPQDAEVGGYDGSHCKFSVKSIKNKVFSRDGESLYGKSGVPSESRRECQMGTRLGCSGKR